MSKKIVVHPHVDLDACICVALTGADPQDVHFVPANVTSLPANCLCCNEPLTGEERVLDHPLGDKGRLDLDGTRHSASASMPEAETANPELLAEVEEQETTGQATPRFPLSKIVTAIAMEASNRGLTGSKLDREVLASMGRVIKGLNLYHAAEEEARRFITRSKIVEIGKWKLAIFPTQEDAPANVGHILTEEHGVCAAIYQQGFSLGVVRYPTCTEPNLRKLEPYLPGWFTHPAGFLACWGSRKAPVTSPPPQGTPQTPEELLALVQRVFA